MRLKFYNKHYIIYIEVFYIYEYAFKYTIIYFMNEV